MYVRSALLDQALVSFGLATMICQVDIWPDSQEARPGIRWSNRRAGRSRDGFAWRCARRIRRAGRWGSKQ